jgi:tetratricopeptide (TPR) repeat protein
MDDLATGYSEAGRWDRSIPLLEEMLKLREKKLGRNHPDTMRTVGNLGVNYNYAGRLSDSLPLLEEALANARKSLAKDSPELARPLAAYGRALLQARSFTEAELQLRECLAIREKVQPDDWRTFNTRSHLGGALLGQKKYAEAEPLLRQGYEGMKARE